MLCHGLLHHVGDTAELEAATWLEVFKLQINIAPDALGEDLAVNEGGLDVQGVGDGNIIGGAGTGSTRVSGGSHLLPIMGVTGPGCGGGVKFVGRGDEWDEETVQRGLWCMGLQS